MKRITYILIIDINGWFKVQRIVNANDKKLKIHYYWNTDERKNYNAKFENVIWSTLDRIVDNRKNDTGKCL